MPFTGSKLEMVKGNGKLGTVKYLKRRGMSNNLTFGETILDWIRPLQVMLCNVHTSQTSIAEHLNCNKVTTHDHCLYSLHSQRETHFTTGRHCTSANRNGVPPLVSGHSEEGQRSMVKTLVQA